MLKKLIYLTIITLSICCKNNDDDTPDCSLVDCISAGISINLIDNSTKENIILRDNITEENIRIQDTLKTSRSFYINENNGLLIIAKEKNEDTLEILINANVISNFSYETSNPTTNNCCDFGKLINVLVESKTFKLEDGIITIYL